MKLMEVLVVLTFCGLSSAFGHLNDTRPQLIDRFGAPALEKANQAYGSLECIFQKGEWEVHAFLIDGRCHMLSFLKKAEGPGARATAVFKTGYWKMLEGQPLGMEMGVSWHRAGDLPPGV